jgi:hypothetical protein
MSIINSFKPQNTVQSFLLIAATIGFFMPILFSVLGFDVRWYVLASLILAIASYFIITKKVTLELAFISPFVIFALWGVLFIAGENWGRVWVALYAMWFIVVVTLIHEYFNER